MPLSDITPFSLTDRGLNASTANSIPVSAGPGQVPTFTAPAGVRDTIQTPLRTDVVHVEDPKYGAKGDGTTDDTVAIRAALATGLSIRMTKGKTYLVSGNLAPVAGQTIHGQGATIKRISQVSTTTTTTITANTTTQITVADASSFRVGMDINIVNGATYDNNGNRTITSIVGNVITVSTTFSVSASGTTTVYSSAVMVTLAADAAVEDLVLDGNKAGQSWFHWEVSVGILMQGDRAYASHCHVLNSPGEGIEMQANYLTVAYCVVETPNGNGIHLTGAINPVIDSCRVINPNQDQSNGHVMGCVGFSNSITDATIVKCYLYGGVAGVGAIDSSDNSDVTIANNVIRGTVAGTGTVATVAGIDINASSAGSVPARITITGNRIYNCQYNIRVSQASSNPTAVPAYVLINGSYFHADSTANPNVANNIVLNRVQNITITGCALWTNSTSILNLDIEQSQWVNVTGCQIIGGGYGVYSEPVAVDPDSLNILGNTFYGQKHAAVSFQDAVTNSSISNNVIEMSDNTNSGYSGVICYGPTMVSGNMISIAAGTGVQPNASTATGTLLGMVMEGNRITGSGTSIQPFGSAGHILIGNISSFTATLGNTGTTCSNFPQLTFSGTHSGALQTGTSAITISGAGAGFADGTYNLIFVGGGGTGAAGTATASGGVITATNVTAGGSGYTSAPKVYVTCTVLLNNVTA